MQDIFWEHKPSPAKLDVMGVYDWPIWEKEISTFQWTYEDTETCYLLAGEVVITPEDGEPVTFRKGDLITFAKGLRCTWDIRAPVRKHYDIG